MHLVILNVKNYKWIKLNKYSHGLETRNYEWTKVGHCSKAVFLEKRVMLFLKA